MKKKKAEIIYKQYVKSFSCDKYHRVIEEINDIIKNKKSVLVNVILKHVRFAMQKIIQIIQ